ncbi:MAG: imidazole glycerol phosphate synthase cyclase subunit [Bacteroidota bacterium]
MKKNIRIIPKLDIKGPNLVKGIHLEGLRVLGQPEDYAKYYYESGADELIYMDVVASLYNRNSLHDIISRTAQQVFIPLTVGGGLRTIEDIRKVLRVGADKVVINTAAINNPNLIKDAANLFGSSTITISIEASKQKDGTYLAYTDNGREHTGIEVISWASKTMQLGAGEIILTSIDREGTGDGYDLELVKKVSEIVSIPVISCGGAGKNSDVLDVIMSTNTDAVAISSMLHYHFLKHSNRSIRTRAEGNTEFMKSGKTFSKIKTTDIRSLKKYLSHSDILCRYEPSDR